MAAERYRAYAMASATKSVPQRDSNGNVEFNAETGEPIMVIVSETPVEEVVFEGPVVDNVVTFDAGAIVITRVVGYAGPVETEAVVGSANCNASGVMTVDFGSI